MTVTNTAAFGQVPNIGQAIVTAAKTNPFSGATGAVLLFTAGSNGSIINAIGAIPRDTITAAVLCIYFSSDGGTTLNLIGVATVTAYTYGATVLPTAAPVNHMNGVLISPTNPLYVTASKTLYASCTVALANGLLVSANGVDL